MSVIGIAFTGMEPATGFDKPSLNIQTITMARRQG